MRCWVEHRQVGCWKYPCTSLPEQDKEYIKNQQVELQRWGCVRVRGWTVYSHSLQLYQGSQLLKNVEWQHWQAVAGEIPAEASVQNI